MITRTTSTYFINFVHIVFYIKPMWPQVQHLILSAFSVLKTGMGSAHRLDAVNITKVSWKPFKPYLEIWSGHDLSDRQTGGLAVGRTYIQDKTIYLKSTRVYREDMIKKWFYNHIFNHSKLANKSVKPFLCLKKKNKGLRPVDF